MYDFSTGMNVELVSKVNLARKLPSELLNLGITSSLVKRHSKTNAIATGTLGYIINIDNNLAEVCWQTGQTTLVIIGVDNIRHVKMPVLVYRPFEKLHMNDWELAQWANTVHQIAGGKGEPFKPADMYDRLKGHHCNCGVNASGYSNGIFKLLSLNSEDVRIGCKPYMICKQCGCLSHL